MTSKFPLFDSLNNIVSDDEDITMKEKTDIVKKIKLFDKQAHELIYSLIKAYQINNKDTCDNTILPFNGKSLKSGLKFDLDVFPYRLQNIISKFVNMHENSIS